jgi:diadenosine tetraphosphate (Ap4A) HIT family hydrolase
MAFVLHPRIDEDTILIGNLGLSRVLLMNNKHFPWVILVPRIADAVELTELSDADYSTVTTEIRHVAQAMQKLYQPIKMNIAALGNQVRQLHIHIVARFESDVAWPNPIWGAASEAYADAEASHKITELQRALFE